MSNKWQESKKEKTHKKILSQAAGQVRKHGIQGASLTDIMKSAGLTVGGFYAHFASKEDLVAQAFREMVSQVKSYSNNSLTFPGPERLKEFLGTYLSSRHRDSFEKGCPMAALALEFAREKPELRKVFSEQFGELLDFRNKEFSSPSNPMSREEALFLISSYVGALILSRATTGESISEEILEATSEQLKRRFCDNSK
jgi:AcrR family transcriptional regulator